MTGLLLVAVIVVVALVLLARFMPKGKGAWPYEREQALFTPAERSFLGVLDQAVGQQFRIMGKVRLADIVKVKAGLDNTSRQRAFNRIQSKHVDFVACDPGDLSVQFVVELDDKSHARPDRRDRDALIDQVLQAAGIPIIHFPVRKAYSVQEVQDTLEKGLNPPASAPVSSPQISTATPPPVAAVAATVESEAAPTCPACGATMVRRRSSKGQNAGTSFWGCSSYPKCRQIVPVA